MYLIRQMAKKYNLTRTSLLHYDAIGLLSPSIRTGAGYRLYGEEDEKKLQHILLLRSMGVALDNIRQLLGSDTSKLANALLIRLAELNREIEALKQRQRNIINLFKDVRTLEELLISGNLDENIRVLFDGIHPVKWHEQFESVSPDLHKEFLEVLNSIPASMKASIQASLNSLPEEERNGLSEILRNK